MIAKDILRIVLFLLVAIFALRSGFHIGVRGSDRTNKLPETEDTDRKQLLQLLQDNRDKINQEPVLFENQTARKEI
jgi:hypothetical protein